MPLKILFVHRANPEVPDSQQKIFPNGVYYIAALLRENNYDVILKNYSDFSEEEIIEDLKKEKPNVVGISCYTFNAYNIFELCKIIKNIDKEIKIVLGGPHATALDKEILGRVPYVDLIARNESENTILEILKFVEKNEDLSNISGITYRKNSEIIKNKDREAIKDLNCLPIPAKYFKYQRIITSRGCPGNCIFCSTPSFWGRKVRFRSASNIVEELEMLNKKFGISYFIFSDDTFTASKERTIEICKLIIDKGLKITWDCRSRVNFVCDERVEWMKKAGCISISYGVESGSEKILKNINKNITVEQIIKASELTKKYGLQLNFFIIVGSPGDDDSTINETIELIKKTKPHDILISIMQLTPDIELCLKQNINLDCWFNKNTEAVYYTKEHSENELKEYAEKVNEEFKKNKGSYKFNELVKMIKEDPTSAVAFNNLGSLYLFNNKLKDAFICFGKAINLNPGYSQPYNNIGVVLIKSNQQEEAIICFKKAHECNPEDVRALNNMATLYFSMGKRGDAKDCFKKVLEIDPENKKARENLGLLG